MIGHEIQFGAVMLARKTVVEEDRAERRHLVVNSRVLRLGLTGQHFEQGRGHSSPDHGALTAVGDRIGAEFLCECDDIGLGMPSIPEDESFEENTVVDDLTGFGLEDENGEAITEENDDEFDSSDDEF